MATSATKPGKPEQVLEPWERRQKESAKAYEAFCMYRDLGASRSQAKVADQLGKSPKLMGRWSSDYAWVERVEAWDRFVAAEQRAAHIEQVKAMERRHMRVAENMIALADAALMAKLRKVEPGLAVGATEKEKETAEAVLAGLTTHEVIRLAEVGSKTERVARGEPETITEVQQTHTWADAVVQRRREREAKEQAAQQGDSAVSEGAEQDGEDGGGSDG